MYFQTTVDFPSWTSLDGTPGSLGRRRCLHGYAYRFHGDPTRECLCTGGLIQRYLGKISGALFDRIDLHIEVPAVPYKELRGKEGGITSAEML